MSKLATILVSEYVVCDDDEGVHQADNPQDFEDSVKLLTDLREENPEVSYTLYAAIDA